MIDSLATVTRHASALSPELIIAWIGVIIMISFTGWGSILGTTIAGNATIGSLKKNEDIFGGCMLLSALPGTQGLYGFGGFYILKSKIIIGMPFINAYAILAAGIIMGVVGYLSSTIQARVVANGIESMGQGNDVFGKTLILAVYPELFAIIAFAVVFMISTMIV
jgi:V/A-type H+/Na+-transporting ATPase subunit K